MMLPHDLDALLTSDFAERFRLPQFHRRRRAVRVIDATHVHIDGRRYVNFASNNYLGLTHHPRVVEAMRIGAEMYGAGSGAAPLVTGYTSLHAAAERAVAAWKGTEDAVLFSSGLQANYAAIGALSALASGAGANVRFLLDKLCHASLIDAVRATDAPFRVFPHNGVGKLRRLLEDADPAETQVVVTESIFSMDGDAADLPALADLKKVHPFILLLDEAHGGGVYGPGGAGYAAEVGLPDLADVTIVTFSKALGAVGGAVCGSASWCDAVVNLARPYLFSTSLPPPVAESVIAGIETLREEPERQARVRDLARHVRAAVAQSGLVVPPGDSPIIPILLGDEHRALDAAALLADRGLLVVAIRPPTVPPGTSRLRVTLSCEHKDGEIEELLKGLRSLV